MFELRCVALKQSASIEAEARQTNNIGGGQTVARKRIISPAFFEDTTLADLPIQTRYTYIGLWPWLDRQGVVECDTRLLRRKIFPYDDDITHAIFENMLLQLVRADRLRGILYEEKKYLFCPRFEKHQHFHHREVPLYPVPKDVLQRSGPLKPGASPSFSFSFSISKDNTFKHSDQPEALKPHSVGELQRPVSSDEETTSSELEKGNAKNKSKQLELVGGETHTPPPDKPPRMKREPSEIKIPGDYNDLYELYPRHEGRRQGLAKFRQVIKTKEDLEKAKAWAKIYSDEVKAGKREIKFTQLIATFLHQERWLDPLPVNAPCTARISQESMVEVNDRGCFALMPKSIYDKLCQDFKDGKIPAPPKPWVEHLPDAGTPQDVKKLIGKITRGFSL